MTDFLSVGSAWREPVDWNADADEWVAHLRAYLVTEDEPIRCNGSKGYASSRGPFVYASGPPQVVELTASSRAADPVGTFLVVRAEGSEIELLVASREELDTEAEEAWARAARSATSELASPQESFDWVGMVGGVPLHGTGVVPTLSSSTPIGPFQLSTTDRPAHDQGPPALPSLNQIAWGTSWVTVVTATHSGYSWDDAQRRASGDLQRLCGLLSIALDACVVVRETPRPLAWRFPVVPKAPLPWQHNLHVAHGDEWPVVPVEQAETPSWLPNAWDLLAARPWLAAALAVHYEGLQIEFAHPTLSLVAYVSAIEALGARLFKAEKCPTCHAYTKVRERFEATLRLVLPDEQAAPLGHVYPTRSKTVHEGRLYGDEAVPMVLGPVFLNPGRDFQFGTVTQLRKASTQLLVRALRTTQSTPRRLLSEEAGA